MGEEMSTGFRLALREELGPVYDRLTAIEVSMREQKEAASKNDFDNRLRDLEKKHERLQGKIIGLAAGLGAASGLLVSLLLRLIGS